MFETLETILFEINLNIRMFDQTFLLTLALALPTFCGVNAGFPCIECENGLAVSLRSPPDPEALRRSIVLVRKRIK